MKALNIFLILFLSMTLMAQTTKDPNIPDVVQKSFSRKLPRAENVSWDKVGDNYKVDCFYKGHAAYAEFTKEGTWVITISDLDTKALYRPIQMYLDENFKKEKIILAEKAMKADKQDYYYVQLTKKDKITKEDLIIELFFDKTGNIEQVKLPEGVEEMTVVGIDDPNMETPAIVIDKWQRRFPKAENIEWTKKENPSDSIDYNYVAYFDYREQNTIAEFLPNGQWYETRTEYDEKNLYIHVVKYINENHYKDDLIIAEKVTRSDRKDYYYVKLERMEKGQARPWIFELFFNKSGKIQKVIRPEELSSQYLLTVDIPPTVAKKFNGRFSSAKDVTWEQGDKKWNATFTYRNLPTTAEFSDSAQWIVTVVELEIKGLYAPVQRTLDKDYSDYKVTYAEKATRKDRKDYYYVELVAKKKNASPHKLGLFFDKTGRLKENK